MAVATPEEDDVLKSVRCKRIDLEDLDYNHDAHIGGGGFGDVTKGKWKHLDVAIKIINQQRFTKDQEARILACKEARAMCEIRHQSIVQLYGIVIDGTSKTYALVLEYMQHNSLCELNLNAEIPDGLKVEMMMDIANAVCYLHLFGKPKLQLIHADIKLSNILVNDRFQAKIGDFGVSMLQGYTSKLTGSKRAKGTVTHMAPELFNPELVGLQMPKNSCETDVWSFGITLYELLKKEGPFPGDLADAAIINQIAKGIKSYCTTTLEGSHPKILIDVALNCLEQEAATRPTFETIAYTLHQEYVEKYKSLRHADIQNLYRTLTGENGSYDEVSFNFGRDDIDANIQQELTRRGTSRLAPSGAQLRTSVDELANDIRRMNLSNTPKLTEQVGELQRQLFSQGNRLNEIEKEQMAKKIKKLKSENARLKQASPASLVQQSSKPYQRYSPKQQKLVDNLMYFRDNLMPENVYDYYIQESILSMDEKERIEKTGITRGGQASKLIEVILLKGDRAIDVLCQALRKEGQGFLADRIEWVGSGGKRVFTT